MGFNFNQEYRESQEYKEWVSAIRRDYPNLPLYLIELAIANHKTSPQHYKTAKDAKEVFTKAPKQSVNNNPQTIEGAIQVIEVEKETTAIIEEVTA